MIDVSSMMTQEETQFSDIEDKAEILAMFDEALAYLTWHTWCQGLESIRFAAGFAYVTVFFVEALLVKGGSRPYWVVVGDLPPLYLDTADGTLATAADALEGYTIVMEGYVEASYGIETEWEVPPVLVRHSLQSIPPSREYADLLARRLLFLRRKVVPAFREGKT